MLKTGMMNFWKNPCLKGKSGGKGSDGDERTIFSDDPVFLLKLLPNDITIDTSVFIGEIVFGSFDLFAHRRGDDGKGDDLRMGMFQRGSRRDAIVFEDEDISKPLVPPQIDDPFTIGP